MYHFCYTGKVEKVSKILQKIPRNVFFLGFVSFFNDLSSEMIYPIVPIFLTSVLHTSIPLVGLIEGIAEATSSVAKFIFGVYSDYIQKRKPFVIGGYSFGAVSKVLIGIATSWHFVLFARFIDRLGKGLRTAARDSLLLENAKSTNKGLVFGFHRAFDSLGAVFGPLVALILLYFLHENIRLTFLLAFAPAVVAVLLLFIFVKEKRRENVKKEFHFKKFRWHILGNRLKIFLLISFIFAVGNSSDAFLLLQAKNLGLTTTLVVFAYVLYNISQTIFSTPLGKLSDKIGAKKVFSGGLLVFGVIYLLFGIVSSPIYLWLLFPIYGIYIAATDGVSKAFIGDFISVEESGTFYGLYYFLTAIGTFLASFVGGILWAVVAPHATFLFGSVMAFAAFFIFNFSRRFEA